MPRKEITPRGQAAVLAAINRLISRYKRKRAACHKRMMHAHERNDEMTQVVAGAMALAYTDAQTDLEKLVKRKSGCGA